MCVCVGWWCKGREERREDAERDKERGREKVETESVREGVGWKRERGRREGVERKRRKG